MPIPAAALAAIAGEVGAGTATAAGGAGAASAAGSTVMGQLGPALGMLTGQFQGMQGAVKGLTGSFTPLKGEFGILNQLVHKLTNTFNRLAPVIQETVGLFSPITLLQFNRALMDLKAVFGSVFRPVLQEVTTLVRRLANYFYSLPPAFKSVLASLARTTVISGLVATLAASFALLGAAMAAVKAVFGPIVYVFDQIRGTARGMSGLQSILSTLEGSVAGFFGAIQSAWDSTAGMRAQLKTALGELINAFGEYYRAIQPLLALNFAVVAKTWEINLKIMVFSWTVLTKSMEVAQRALNKFLGPLGKLIGMLGFNLPDMNRPQQNAMGLGFGGASVSDPASVYNRLTEEIARGSRPQEEKKEDPAERVADSMDDWSDLLQKALMKYLMEGQQGPAGQVLNPVNLANPVQNLRNIGRGIGLLFGGG